MKKLALIAFTVFLLVSCNKDFKSALNMPGSQNVKKNFNTEIKADEFSNDFYKTCAYGKVNEVANFIKQGKSVNELDDAGYSPLFYAVLGGNPSAYSECLTKLRSAIIKDNDTELYEALDCVPDVKSNTKVVNYLLKNGANVQLKDRNERPVFVYAALFANDVNILAALKKAGAEIHEKITIQYPSSLLSIACMTNPNAHIIDFLCKEGDNIDEQNKFGTTPIMWAAMYTSNPKVIDVLIKNGADINDKRHKDKYAPYDWAIRCNRNDYIIDYIQKLGGISTRPKYSKDDIGKIILINGKVVTAKEYDVQSLKAIAIIWNVDSDGSYALGMGLNTSRLAWADKDSYGYIGRIEGLEDLTDGSKAWDIVKEKDPNGINNAKKYYPALFFAHSYGEIYNVGEYKDGWFIPTYEECGNCFHLVWDNGGEKSYTYWSTLRDTFDILNLDWPMEFWCSNSDRYENTYDWWLGGYFWRDLPKNIKFSRNQTSVWGEKGASPFLNSDKYTTVVMRKFE